MLLDRDFLNSTPGLCSEISGMYGVDHRKVKYVLMLYYSKTISSAARGARGSSRRSRPDSAAGGVYTPHTYTDSKYSLGLRKEEGNEKEEEERGRRSRRRGVA